MVENYPRSKSGNNLTLESAPKKAPTALSRCNKIIFTLDEASVKPTTFNFYPSEGLANELE